MAEAYITGIGAYLPGEPIDNAQLAGRLADGTTRGATLGRQALAANGIKTRHYATDDQGRTLLLNEELAASAARCALADRGLPASAARMLATGTTQGDVLVPGFASMVHGRLGGGPMEVLSAAGVCASSMAALKAAVAAVRLGEHRVALAVGSELASRSLAAGAAPGGKASSAADTVEPADAGFLRWTLSDGAGAVVVEPEPRPGGLSLRVDWMHLVSHAHEHPVCMCAGLDPGTEPRAGTTWLDRRDPPDPGPVVPRLRQDMSALGALIDMGVAEYTALVEAGRIDPGTEHVLCHYSAEHFRAKLLKRLRAAGHDPVESRWFTNLHTAGNTGAASIFVMLAAARPRLRAGDRVLLIVPESGRFSLAFAQLTCVGPAESQGSTASGGRTASRAELAASPLGQAEAASPVLGELAVVWADFQRRLARVPVVRRIEDGTATLEDYRRLLLNLRQQVVDGGRWISLAASSFSAGLFWLRSAAIQHAAAEHRDFQLLERDYSAAGGDPRDMTATPANIGSAALSAFMFHRAGQPDPVDLLGAMFVIEGLGAQNAGRWAGRLQQSLGLSDEQVSFLRYHSVGDDEHFEVLRAALTSGLLDDAAMTAIARTARVVARLYALQLEELDHV